jgi:putative ABC transport system substrate-binding protein
MRRREFLAGFATTVVWPLTARAQQPDQAKRIGALMFTVENDPEARARVAAFRRGLAELGWIEGRNIGIEFRWSTDIDTTQAAAAELVAMKSDVLLALSSQGLTAAQRETRSIPIVFMQVADPVGSGRVASLAQPGGNITGFATSEEAIGAKWLEFLREISPQIARVGVLRSPATPSAGAFLIRAIEAAAPSLGVHVTAAGIRDLSEVERAFETFARESIEGLIVMPDPVNSINNGRIIELAAKHRLPAVYPFRYYSVNGGVISYGANIVDMWWRAASYVDRILRGSKPADLPVQNPIRYDLIINLKTAKALGLEIPPALLTRADEVIE